MPRSGRIAVFALLVLAPTAHAGTVSVADGRVRFEAAPGERNVVRLGEVDGQVEVSDRAGGLVAGDGCRLVLPRRALCAGDGAVMLCGDGDRDRVENPGKDVFVDASCERVRFYEGYPSVRNSLTVLSHPVRTTARSATFWIRCQQTSDNDFGEYNDCDGSMLVSDAARRLGARGFASRATGSTFPVTVPLASRPDDAVVVGIELPGYHARWSVVL
jgi:hypothetical protein